MSLERMQFWILRTIYKLIFFCFFSSFFAARLSSKFSEKANFLPQKFCLQNWFINWIADFYSAETDSQSSQKTKVSKLKWGIMFIWFSTVRNSYQSLLFNFFSCKLFCNFCNVFTIRNKSAFLKYTISIFYEQKCWGVL